MIGRDQRREARRKRCEGEFGADADVALDFLDVTELAWHDCYGEISFSDDVLDDLLRVAGGDVRQLVAAGKLGLTDWRDLRVAADRLRA